MSHIPINKLFILLLCCCIYLAGCTGSSKKSEDDSVSESEEGFSSTEVMGSLGHGLASYLVDEDIGAAYVTYEGGELKIDYKASSTGMFECGVGFMIFIDGVAQPYKTSEETEVKYMHTFHFQDNIENEFSFYFVPTVGQKGDMLELCIASIYNPDYQPDMDESKGYGIFHDMLTNSYIIKYDASPAKIDSEVSDLDLISSLKIEELDVQDNRMTENLEKDIHIVSYINDADITNGNYYIANEEKNNIKLEICGTNSTEYRVCFFVNHRMISGAWEEQLRIHVRPNKMTVLEAEMDISLLEGYDTFYAVIVPCDTSQILQSSLMKTNSVLLISSFNREEEGNSKIILNEFSGTINCVKDDGLLLVDTRRILRMDSLALEVQKEAENTAPLLINPQAKTTEDAYLLMGETFEGWSFKLIEYDRNLHLKQIADIAEAVVSEREIMTCKLFSGGDKLLYNNINGLYLFDFASDKTTNLTQDGIFIYDFACLEQTGEILFSGSNSSEERVLGIVDMNGEKQQEESAGHLWGGIWAFEDFALIEEAELVGRGREGAVFRYDAEGGIRSFPFSDSNENGNITVSCHGDYYATRTTLVGDESHYVIRIYSSKDGNMVKELPLTYEEYGDDFRLRGFLICDDVNRIILYGTWKGQETNTWIVSESL